MECYSTTKRNEYGTNLDGSEENYLMKIAFSKNYIREMEIRLMVVRS